MELDAPWTLCLCWLFENWESFESWKLSLCITIHWEQSIFKILAHLGSCLSSDTGAFLFLQPLPSSGLDVSHRTRMLSDEKTFSQQLHLARLLLSISPCRACFPHNFWLWSCRAPLPCQSEESVFRHHKHAVCSQVPGLAAALRRNEALFGTCSCAICLTRNRVLRVGCYSWFLCTHPFDTKQIACWLDWRQPGSANLSNSLHSFQF